MYWDVAHAKQFSATLPMILLGVWGGAVIVTVNCAKDFKGTAYMATVNFIHILLMGGFCSIASLISNNLSKCNLHFNIPWPEDLSTYIHIRAVGIFINCTKNY